MQKYYFRVFTTAGLLVVVINNERREDAEHLFCAMEDQIRDLLFREPEVKGNVEFIEPTIENDFYSDMQGVKRFEYSL